MQAARSFCGGHTSMQPKTGNDLKQLTKEEIGELYFQSLGNHATRKNHVLLIGGGNPTTTPPQSKAIENDCMTWYAGVVAFGKWVDPGTELPPTQEVVAYISKNFERARSAIAA